MKMHSLLLGTAALAASAGLASAATITMAGHTKAPHHVKNNAVNRSLSVLYDQNGDDTGVAVISQNFESTFATYDSAAADDFTTTGKWKIKEVDITGAYFQGFGPATSEDVTIYSDKKGKPSRVVWQALDVVGADDKFGSFVIPIGKQKALKSGKTYWLSVVANCAYLGGCGQWGWETQSETVGNPAQWENPSGGFGECPTWTDENVCVPDSIGDHLFTIRGTSN